MLCSYFFLSANPGQLDPVELMFAASPVVKLVLVVLIAMSIACWFIIGIKWLRLKKAQKRSLQFHNIFWSDGSNGSFTTEKLENIYTSTKELEDSPIAKVFRAGYIELAQVMQILASPQQPGATAQFSPKTGIENVERAMTRASIQEMTQLETSLSILATTGSTAPFVGLFGTVWGIMNSFISIHGNKNASLDVVAPGIAEALIATAIGLAAAIPSVMAYNYFIRRLHIFENEINAFSSDYLNVIRRFFLKD